MPTSLPAVFVRKLLPLLNLDAELTRMALAGETLGQHGSARMAKLPTFGIILLMIIGTRIGKSCYPSDSKAGKRLGSIHTVLRGSLRAVKPSRSMDFTISWLNGLLSMIK